MPISNWSTIPSDNGTADSASGIFWPEGMSPAQINDSARAMMAETKKLYLSNVGTITPFAGASAPQGWLFCYGQNVSRSTYASLFAVLGTAHGAGDGSTTFTLPDLRGRSIFGKDDMGGAAANRITSAVSGIAGTTLGASGGDQRTQAHSHTGSGTTSTIGDHLHDVFSYAAVNLAGGGIGYNVVSGSTTSGYAGSHAHTYSFTTSTFGAGGSQNMPPAAILNFIIFAGV
jgi:microcystin-dependent protein